MTENDDGVASRTLYWDDEIPPELKGPSFNRGSDNPDGCFILLDASAPTIWQQQWGCNACLDYEALGWRQFLPRELTTPIFEEINKHCVWRSDHDQRKEVVQTPLGEMTIQGEGLAFIGNWVVYTRNCD